MVSETQPLDAPIGHYRPFKVITVGAGLAGIHFAARFRKYSHGINLQIYEKNSECGGTWLCNTYPGVSCDVPSHAYSFTWAPYTEWNRFHAPGEDCLNYCKFVAKKARLDDVAKYNNEVLRASWIEKESIWEVVVQDTTTKKVFTDKSNVLINASGLLSRPKYPDVPGRETFENNLLHSGSWDNSIELKGKRIALIGAGSSALQILPNIQKGARHIDQYIRTSTWVTPPTSFETRVDFFGLSKEGTYLGTDPKKLNPYYTDEHKKKFRNDPMAHLDHRKQILSQVNGIFSNGITDRDSFLQKISVQHFSEITKSKLVKKPELAKYFIPTDFGIGCRRITPSVGYMEAVQEDNVQVVPTEIERFYEKGIIGRDGKHREYDVIICATGFKTSASTYFPVFARNNVKLHTKEFADNAKAYMCCHFPDVPNYFSVPGRNFISHNGDALIGLEKLADYAFKFVIKLQRENYKSVCVKHQVVEDFNAYIQNYLQRTVHTQGCSSWYKHEKTGQVNAIWCGTSLHFIEALASPRWEDFDWEPLPNEEPGKANRFNFLGNGRTLRELNGGDLGYYIEQVPFNDDEVEAFNPKNPSYAGIPSF